MTLSDDPPLIFGSGVAERPICLAPDQYLAFPDHRFDNTDFLRPINRKDVMGLVRVVWYSFDHEEQSIRTSRLFWPVH